MKVLVTGCIGFVAGHLKRFFEERGAEIYGIDRRGMPGGGGKSNFRQVDLMDREAVRQVLADVQPNAIVHLAAVSSVGQSWQQPVESFMNNTNIFLSLAESVRELNLKARILSVGSSEEYGNFASSEMPLKETHELRPISPYSVARVAQEMLSRLYAESYGLDIVMTRSFNHIGPGQRAQFVIPSFLRQLMDVKTNGGEGVLTVGNVDVVRDFTDVRDVVDAYWKILLQGKRGRVYNVCSGRGRSLREIIDDMAHLLDVKVALKVDSALVRPADNAVIIGDNSRLKDELGWRPQHAFEQTVRDMMQVEAQ